ncbi:interferon regulatory factor 3-like [Stegostoma tigrinum]|uniref:interferon regulatory factor 3-like n=1 Tax=Stegostoma tigrinum TaxID=3053191 RepID=UPI002870444F|nr:interferon regulatory factor 3-like [Stegostoma tigrinum]
MSACAPAIPRGHAACAVPAQRSMLSRRHRDGRMSVVPSSTPKLKQWMIEQVDSEKYPGLVWEDRKLGMFRIPWKHANHQDYRHDKDAAIFEAWARFKGPCRDLRNLNPRTWKSRLRCALHKSSDFVEVPERSQLNNYQPYKVYKIVDSSFSQERMSPSIHLLAVKLEINDSDGMENSQQSSPGTQLGVSEQQAECEVPPLHYQQAESDSSCEPFSGFEASPPEEACVENTSLKWRLPAPDRDDPVALGIPSLTNRACSIYTPTDGAPANPLRAVAGPAADWTGHNGDPKSVRKRQPINWRHSATRANRSAANVTKLTLRVRQGVHPIMTESVLHHVARQPTDPPIRLRRFSVTTAGERFPAKNSQRLDLGESLMAVNVNWSPNKALLLVFEAKT